MTRNTAVLMGSQLVTWISTFVLMIFLPRYLGSEDFGRLYLAMSVAMMFQVFIEFGGPYFIAKEISRSRPGAPGLIVNSVGLRLILTAISILLMVSFSFIAGYHSRVKVLIGIFAFAKIWEGAHAVLASSFQGFERMEYRSVTSIAERVFLSAAGVVALLMGAESPVIALLMAASTLLSFLLASRFILRLVPRFPRIDWTSLANLLRKGVPYLMLAVFAVIYYRINAVMLSLMTPEAVVGWFGAAFRFFDTLMFLPSIFSIAVFPVLARIARERENVARTTQKSLDFILLAGIPVSICTFAFAGDIIRILFGLSQYAPSVPVLQVLSPGVLLVYVDFVLVTALVALDRQRQWSYVALSAIPLSVALNYWLIPTFQTHAGNGGIGSAIATNATELFIMVSALVLMPRGVFAHTRIPVTVKAAAAGVAMALALWGLRVAGLSWVLQAFLGLAVYAAVILSARVLEPAEVGFFRRFFTLRELRRTFIAKEGADA